MRFYLNCVSILISTVILLSVSAETSRADTELLNFKNEIPVNSALDGDATDLKYEVSINTAALEQPFSLSVPNQPALLGKPTAKKNRETYFGVNTETFSGKILTASSTLEGEYVISRSTSAGGTESWYGTLRAPDGREFEVSSSSNSTFFNAIDSTKQFSCAGSIGHEMHSTNTDFATGLTSNPSTKAASINLLVAYTPDAVSLAGSEEAILAKISTIVESANTAYSGSQTGVTINLVGTYALSQSSNQNFLTDLYVATDSQGSPDDPNGQWDELQSLRDTYCADMVTVLVGNTAGGVCGIAWIPGASSQIPNRSSLMYSVVSAAVTGSCSTYTLAHELGHNFGSDHDLENTSNATTAFSYSYGWRFFGNSSVQYHTVMAYDPGIRIPYFSSPSISYDGVAVGDSSQANNAASILATAPIVAAFQPEGDSCAKDAPIDTPANEPDKVELSAASKSLRSGDKKITFQLYATRLGVAMADAQLELQYDRKKNGSFTKVIKTLKTKSTGVAKYSRALSKLSKGYYRGCFFRQYPNGVFRSNLKEIEIKASFK